MSKTMRGAVARTRKGEGGGGGGGGENDHNTSLQVKVEDVPIPKPDFSKDECLVRVIRAGVSINPFIHSGL